MRLKKEYDDLGKYLKELENCRPSRKSSNNEWQDNTKTGIHVRKVDRPLEYSMLKSNDRELLRYL
jgi:hypothetical protein